MSGVLDGEVAVVTGGTSGIGLAIARRFVAEGARVFVTGRRQAQVDAAATGLGPQAVGVRCDVGNLSDLDALYDVVARDAGRIDVLVANAGGAVPAVLADITEEQFDATFATNVKGVLFGVQKAMRLLSPGASVILVGSTTSLRPDRGLEVYGATKAAVRNLARSWTLNAQENGFRVNVLSPGPTRTPGLLGIVPEDQQDDFAEALAAALPAGRLGDPDEIAAAALLLASDAAAFVNGAEWFVDGGRTSA
ncbi:NAD(P)-dependent dehydrogenase (short-subunit alcohol dehydrogenase family) [Kineococcus radiotolerans]|uniref:NAD(P)-dependent dehydrogenase (Short-subunit alcohol dehydrogenase family) n=1 Tax=Kineococcus radiotolerans TaxID=131568 RepID=A0A7W4XWH6_KINRA|nr:SDR family oxidoreductase [Kineococcus radiotolerans]MBB2900873.1 NAD(P)-dependent dehydrogenase (short-subunit alcohol dehydrogenase family) [Kineococcus radiotolerans]